VDLGRRGKGMGRKERRWKEGEKENMERASRDKFLAACTQD